MKRFIYFLLALLGVVGCDSISSQRVEYGVPHVTFKLSARVVDSEGNPIKGIVAAPEGEPTGFYRDSGISNNDGVIDAFGSMWPGSQNVIIFQDVDGELNGGEFETLRLDITSLVEKESDGERWCEGNYKAELGDVQMTLKSDEPEEPTDPEEEK